MTGELRDKIMDECPEEFEDELKTFIDDVKSKVNDIQNLMIVKCLDDLDSLADANTLLNDLAESLY